MPRVSFAQLPDDARLWVFGAAAPVHGVAASAMLAAVDQALDGWKAHGVPLVCARDWRDDRFLAVAADEHATGATGCSIDALFRRVSELEAIAGTTLVTSGPVFWRDANGVVQLSERPAFRALGASGDITGSTMVFDTTVLTAGAWRRRFELPAAESWHARLLGLAPLAK
jgi:hypothetical protein